jgi:hypothetical protein
MMDDQYYHKHLMDIESDLESTISFNTCCKLDPSQIGFRGLAHHHSIPAGLGGQPQNRKVI